MPHAVQIQTLSHIYNKKTQALDNISLEIPRGETVGLIGPDGVGKSTLLSIIAGVRKIQTGSVRVLGGDMASKRDRQELSHRIAYMPQGLGRNLYPTLSVYENIDFHARLFGLPAGERRARIRRLLDATGLAPFPDRATGKLSGGMKQKASLCCALVHAPDLLILDEPTTGVDPLSRRQFWALVRDLQRETAGVEDIPRPPHTGAEGRVDTANHPSGRPFCHGTIDGNTLRQVSRSNTEPSLEFLTFIEFEYSEFILGEV